jgi:mono/diheme cytochrome c family protein
MRLVRAGTFVILFAILNSRSSLRAQAAGLASAKVDFLTQIQPIFESSCYGCHGPKVQMAGLRLNEKSAALAGGQSGAVIIPGKSADSPVYRRVAGLGDQPRMPMGAKPLDASQIELIRLWIDRGAEWPDSATKEVVQVQKHWAYIPPKRPPLPKVVNVRWPRNAIDNFLLARLETEKLIPSPEADRVTLLRRLSLDLTGLPPSVEEVDAFLKDRSHNAYEKQVDRLLNSPHYGERWGRLWLDAARYADSDGYEKDKQRWVWFYRDWVINALDRDLLPHVARSDAGRRGLERQ